MAVIVEFAAASCWAYDVLLRWTVPPEPDIAGYRLYSGPSSRSYDQTSDVGAMAQSTVDGIVYYLVPNLQEGTPYYLAVTAYNFASLESAFSNEKLYSLVGVTPPSVDAGPDLSGQPGQSLTLGGPPVAGLSYYWELASGPPATFSNRLASSTSFTSLVTGTFVLTLTAYDASGLAARDSVTVIITSTTQTRTTTRTATSTQTPTRTNSRTSTPTVTASVTLSPTRTRTMTATRTATRSPTPPPTATRSATPTLTRTATPSRTRTQSPTASRTATSSPTSVATRTSTATQTTTSIPTASRTATATPSRTPPPSTTQTSAPTSTRTQSPTASPTQTRSATPTATPLAYACGGTDAPQCDGACPAGTSCAQVGSGCECLAGLPPCGAFVGAPLCWGLCPPEAPICGEVAGACVCLGAPPVSTPTATATGSVAVPTPTQTRKPTSTTVATAQATVVSPSPTSTAAFATPTPGAVTPTRTNTGTATAAPPSPTASATPRSTPRNPLQTPPTLTPTLTQTRAFITAKATDTSTPTPTPTATPFATLTAGPETTSSPTPTATPTSDQPPTTLAPLFIASGGSNDRVAVHYLDPPSGSAQTLTPFTGDGAASRLYVPPVPVSADVDGDGEPDLVLGQSPIAGRALDDRIAVYRLDTEDGPELMDEISAFDGSGASASGNLLAGDVDPQTPGDEILVAEDGSGRRAANIQIFGGLAEGNLRLIRTLPVVPPRMALRAPLLFALGDVVSENPGLEIVLLHQRGPVYVYSASAADGVWLRRFNPLADQPRGSQPALAVGDVLHQRAGDEIVVAAVGKRGAGLVRIFDGERGALLAEFEAFPPGTLRSRIEVWAADVVAELPGSELIVGQGPEGGALAVFSLADGHAQRLLEMPDASQRTNMLRRFLTVGDLLPGFTGNEIAIAQLDSAIPVAVYHLSATGAVRCATIDGSSVGSSIGAIAAGN